MRQSLGMMRRRFVPRGGPVCGPAGDISRSMVDRASASAVSRTRQDGEKEVSPSGFRINELTRYTEQIALLEAHYLVARMVQTFQTMASQESRDWEELFALAITCKYGVKVKMDWA